MTTSEDPFDLQRFIDAQAPVIGPVYSELRAGHKRTHWIWFIFPQIKGLGMSATSRRFAISCHEEATAYLGHPILGARLIECTQLVNEVDGRSAHAIFGDPDCMKFHSCMTLFATVAGDNAIFQNALTKYFSGKPDPATLQQL